MIDLVSKRYLWFAISLLVIVPGFISLLLPGRLNIGIDFSGGTLWEFAIPNRTTSVSTTEVENLFRARGPELDPAVQVTPIDEAGQQVVTVRTREVKAEDALQQEIEDAALAAFPGAQLTRFETVGSTVSRESTIQAVFAVFAASLAILGYLTFAFRQAPHPVRYGVCAVLAMLHDVLLVLGLASILGRLIGLEIDALFLTAVLTVISFSVHDTIVVFDRVRENLLHRRTGQRFEELVNLAVVQTMTRSINTQLTTLLTLLALLLFGGQTIQHFVLILLIGLLSGTYSSIFNAAQLLVVWENGWSTDWRRVFGREQPQQQIPA